MPDLHLTITSERCNHCDRPPCVTCCPTGASHVHDYGKVVLVDHDKCIGCKACLASCPYGARFVHPEGYADKCTFLHSPRREGRAARLRGGVPDARDALRRPRRPQSEVSRLIASRRHFVLKPDAGTGPRIYYLE